MFNKPVYYKYISLFVLMTGIFVLGYLTNRNDFAPLATVYAICFAAYLLVFHRNEKMSIKQIMFWAILFRIQLLLQIPNLSDDYFRFIWDGQLIANGISPFAYLPPEIAENRSIVFPLKEYLYEHLNALQRSNYTCYTPLNILLFYVSGVLFPKSLMATAIGMRIIIVMAEAGTVFLGSSILKKLQLPTKSIMIYAFNPLVIIELTGNLHFEAVMIFFLIAALYLLVSNKLWLSAIIMGLSISMKLVPVILIPLLFKKLKLKNWLIYSLISGLVVLFFFLPIVFTEGIHNFLKSIALYFKTFEFNASIYYVVRYLGFQIIGFNVIAVAGPLLAAISIVLILAIAIMRKNETNTTLMISLALAYATFYFFSTTVHPWYITTLLALSVFTTCKFPIVWTAVIFLSYFTYSSPDFKERAWLLMLEYSIVFGFMAFEIIRYKMKTSVEENIKASV